MLYVGIDLVKKLKGLFNIKRSRYNGGTMERIQRLLSNIWWGIIFTACMWGMRSHAVTTTAKTTPTQKSTATLSTSGIQATGYIDFRPSWISKTGGFTTEDTVELGAKLSADTSLTYMQGFNTNLYDPVSPASASGMKLEILSGAIKTKVNKIWENQASGLSLAYENRIYLPIDAGSVKTGNLTAIRNYLKLSKAISNTVKLTMSEVMIPIINTRPGNISSDGIATANNIFENRVYLITDIQLTEKLSLSLPIMFHQTRSGNFKAEAANNSAWSFYVWTSPELDYELTPNLTIGLAYYNNESFFTPNLSKTQFGSALESGEFQFALTASL